MTAPTISAFREDPVAFLFDAVKRMDWLDAERARTYRLIMLIISLGLFLAMILTSRHGVDHFGKPLGTDFIAFWSASTLALGGAPAAAYDWARLYAVEAGVTPVDPGLSTFLYPPPFLLACLPLGLAPYLVSLAAWLSVTGLAYGIVVRRWLAVEPAAKRAAALTILAYPAVLVNIGHGQNGFLTAALLGGGLWLLDRRPWLAGALLGALIIKPQMAFAIPVLILASGRWRVAAAGILASLSFCALSLILLGSGVWTGFFAGSSTARGILEQGLVEPGKMVSMFAAVRVLGGGAAIGYALQAAVALGAVSTLALVARRGNAPAGGHAALCAAATPLISPFFLDYDLTLVAVPLAWLLNEGLRRGFLSWEKAILLCGFALPLFARGLAMNAGIPIAPVVLIALFAATARAVVSAPNSTQEIRHDQAEGFDGRLRNAAAGNPPLPA